MEVPAPGPRVPMDFFRTVPAPAMTTSRAVTVVVDRLAKLSRAVSLLVMPIGPTYWVNCKALGDPPEAPPTVAPTRISANPMVETIAETLSPEHAEASPRGGAHRRDPHGSLTRADPDGGEHLKATHATLPWSRGLNV